MSKFIQRLRIFEQRLCVNYSVKREIKAHRYRLFLQNPPRTLPSYEKLRRRRYSFFVVGVVFMGLVMIQVCFFYGSTCLFHGAKNIDTEHLTLKDIMDAFMEELPTLFGFVFFVCIFLSCCFDFVIYRRWGSSRSFIDWK